MLSMKTTPKTGMRARLVPLMAKGRASVRRRVPPGWRWPIGIVLIVFGFLGFLPVLGFWMIPLGIAVAGMDTRPAWRRWRDYRMRGAVQTPVRERAREIKENAPRDP
ncbi:hypothetical protein [Kangsaoukella pontilimi]|uniref:hypothetical protein n=1 Tax=Kangsaoukella pontilimi TaxID=2691042 RepID=UPI001D0A0F82|nr:hypothetical protein [Kangsaoukella pontilimi]